MYSEIQAPIHSENDVKDVSIVRENSANQNVNDESQSTKDDQIEENLLTYLRSNEVINSKANNMEEEIREAFDLLPFFPWFDSSISYSKISPSKLPI